MALRVVRISDTHYQVYDSDGGGADFIGPASEGAARNFAKEYRGDSDPFRFTPGDRRVKRSVRGGRRGSSYCPKCRGPHVYKHGKS